MSMEIDTDNDNDLQSGDVGEDYIIKFNKFGFDKLNEHCPIYKPKVHCKNK